MQRKLVSALLALLPVLCFGEECTLTKYHGCLASLLSVTQNNDLAFATTRDQLHSFCSKLKETVVVCVDDHMKNCFSATQTKVFNHVVAGARQFLLELCVEGELQEAYLRHSPCYQNVSEKCAPQYRYLMQLSENADQQSDVDGGLRLSCCAFNDFMLCKYQYVRQECGQDAADFLQQHLDRISSPLIHEHCAHFTYSDNCDLSAAAPFRRPDALVAAMLFALLLTNENTLKILR